MVIGLSKVYLFALFYYVNVHCHFQEPAVAVGEKCPDHCPHINRDGTENLYPGIHACSGPDDQHVHVSCDPKFIGQLFMLVEPELTSLQKERHVKNIEIAQKEVLICIGLALFERFTTIEQKLKEAEVTCDLLFLTLLKTLRNSLELKAEQKRGFDDIDLLCQELEKSDKKKSGKSERKRKGRARKKEEKNAALAKSASQDFEAAVDDDNDDDSSSADSGINVECEQCVIDDAEKDKAVVCQNFVLKSSKLTKCTWRTLEQMLEEDFDDFDENEDLIPEEDIEMFLTRKEDMEAKRQQLRNNLKLRFAEFCDNSDHYYGFNCSIGCKNTNQFQL